MPTLSEKKQPKRFHPSSSSHGARRRALLLALRPSGQPRAQLAWPVLELTALAREIDVEVACTLVYTRSAANQASLVGPGQLEELRALVQGSGEHGSEQPELLLVDAALSPQQHRALSAALGIEVLDRTQLVLALFALRARTRAAKLTIEIARLTHALPRLRETSAARAQGGGGGRGERGNTEVTLAKQRTRARLKVLERELAQAQRALAQQRSRRADAQRVALVGYTNAGKSSWLTALSESETLIADKPFATLETTVRTLRQKSAHDPSILLLDTVGFVRDLPHELVPSFHATLEEAREADLLLVVADASDPNLTQQLAVTEQTLAALAGAERPRLLLLNQCDRLGAVERAALAAHYPEALLVSARSSADVDRVRVAINALFECRVASGF